MEWQWQRQTVTGANSPVISRIYKGHPASFISEHTNPSRIPLYVVYRKSYIVYLDVRIGPTGLMSILTRKDTQPSQT